MKLYKNGNEYFTPATAGKVFIPIQHMYNGMAKLKVLVVDDSWSTRTAIAEALEANGYEVVASGKDGNDAVTLYNQTKPDVMILDIMMPGKNGLDAVSEIRLFDPQANIIVESARDVEALKLRAKILGVSAYLVKPFGLAELTEALKPFSMLERVKDMMR